MKTVLAMTLYDRTPEVIRAVFAALSFPGNRPDIVAVCYDRASEEAIVTVQNECSMTGIELREAELDEDIEGPRCPSRAWNAVLSLVDESHVFCMSSEMILAPHSIGMAYHMAEVIPDAMIVGRAEHCGQSYAYGTDNLRHRTITWSGNPSGLGFAWLLPMKTYREISGFDEIYMNGFCYEDDDFVMRMWQAGTDFLFCDDIMGFHLEHKRDHLKDEDGRVSINAKIFTERFGDINILREWKFPHHGARFDVGMALTSHEKNEILAKECFIQQKLYGQNEPWRAIPVELK